VTYLDTLPCVKQQGQTDTKVVICVTFWKRGVIVELVCFRIEGVELAMSGARKLEQAEEIETELRLRQGGDSVPE
jgi:hypothetical protein